MLVNHANQRSPTINVVLFIVQNCIMSKGQIVVSFCLFFSIYFLPVVQGQVDNAVFIKQGVPQILNPGESFNARITIQNVGTSIWNSLSDADYKLLPINPENNFVWGVSEARFPEDIIVVAPGQMMEFNLELTAPYAIGRHLFQWRMNANGQGFGDATIPVEIWVGVGDREYDCFIDRATLKNKVLLNYRGAFGSSKQTKAWSQYFHDLEGKRPKFDYWPEISELDENDLFETNIPGSGGKMGMLYESGSERVVHQHFQWLADYQLDGVLLERNLANENFEVIESERNALLGAVKNAAVNFDRVFGLKYDVSGSSLEGLANFVLEDWKELVDQGLLKNTSYLWHKGRPVIALFGVGFEENRVQQDPNILLNLIDSLKHNENPAYRASIIGFVPINWNWLPLSEDPEIEKKWQEVFRSLDVISPWSVGAYSNEQDFSIHMDLFLRPDKAFIQSSNEVLGTSRSYMPVIWPGLSNGNMSLVRTNYRGDHDLVSRNDGHFFWQQAAMIKSLDIDMLYINSLDDLNEGTAIYKLISNASELPQLGAVEKADGYQLLAFGKDGLEEPSDWYLKMSQKMGRIIRKEESFNATFFPVADAQLDAGGDQSICYQESFSFAQLERSPTAVELDGFYWETTGVGDLHNESELVPSYNISSKEIGKSVTFILHGSSFGNCSDFRDTLKLFVEDCSVTSVNSIKEEVVLVAPNPIMNKFSVTIPSAFHGGQLLIYDLQGQVLKNLSISSSVLQINGDGFVSGVYLGVLKHNRQLLYFKIIK